MPLKQAVISASALSLLYPQDGIPGYTREAFLDDLVPRPTRTSVAASTGARSVQIDFTEARLSLKLDPSGGLLDAFVALNNRVLARFTPTSNAGSACTPAPAATRTPPTAPTSTTPSSCPGCSG